MFKWPEFKEQRFDIREATVLLTVGGSRSYGTDHPLSDTDYRGLGPSKD